VTCKRPTTPRALGFLLAAGMLAAACFLPGPSGAAQRPVILLGDVGNDTGDPGLEWIGDALLFFLRWHLEPAAILEPAFGPSRGKGSEPVLSGRYRIEGSTLSVTVALGGPAKQAGERVLAGRAADPAAVLSGLGAALKELLPAALSGKLRTGVPSADSRALREFVLSFIWEAQ
jgi:hypothetical protein